MSVPVAGSVELPENAHALVVELFRTDTLIKELTVQKASLKGVLTGLLGEAGTGLVHGRPAVRHTAVHTTRLDHAKLKENYPDAYEACLVASSHHRFTLVERDDQ